MDEERKLKMAAYYQTHRDDLIMRSRENKLLNKERNKLTKQRYWLKNRDRLLVVLKRMEVKNGKE